MLERTPIINQITQLRGVRVIEARLVPTEEVEELCLFESPVRCKRGIDTPTPEVHGLIEYSLGP